MLLSISSKKDFIQTLNLHYHYSVNQIMIIELTAWLIETTSHYILYNCCSEPISKLKTMTFQ